MQFLNQMQGECVSVMPYPVPKLQGIGATFKIKFLLIVEKLATQ